MNKGFQTIQGAVHSSQPQPPRNQRRRRLWLLTFVILAVVAIAIVFFTGYAYQLNNAVQTFFGVTSTPTPLAENSGITGTATTGPTCPVERIPPDPQCAPRPYAGVFNVTNTQGGVVKSFTSGTDGTFSLALPPGTYTISRPATSNPLPRLSPVTITVTQDKFTEINLQLDTGIR